MVDGIVVACPGGLLWFRGRDLVKKLGGVVSSRVGGLQYGLDVLHARLLDAVKGPGSSYPCVCSKMDAGVEIPLAFEASQTRGVCVWWAGWSCWSRQRVRKVEKKKEGARREERKKS